MKILILGCGYIGTKVASLWKEKGFSLTLTTRNPEKLASLSRIGKKSIILKGNDEDEIALLLEEHDVILITIAADTPEDYETAYKNTSQVIRRLASELNRPKTLIYISSTSVYGDQKGQWVDETSPLNGKGDKIQFLIDAEKNYLFLSEIGWQVVVLRFSEIYGPERELSKRVKKLTEHPLPGDGSRYTNMIHREDAARAIDFALRHHFSGIYNIADDEHPTRKELYAQVSKKFGLPQIVWDPSHPPLSQSNKRVSNHKLKSQGFAFHYPKRVLD